MCFMKANNSSDIPSHLLAQNYCLCFQSRQFGGGRSQEGGRRGSSVGHWIFSFQTLLWQLIPGCSSVWWQRDFHVFPKVFYGLFTVILWITFSRNFQIVKNIRWFIFLPLFFSFLLCFCPFLILSLFSIFFSPNFLLFSCCVPLLPQFSLPNI